MDNIKTDPPLTLTTIKAFRQMLDVMEAFIRATELERLEDEKETKT